MLCLCVCSLDSLLLQLRKKINSSTTNKSVLNEIQLVQGSLKTLKFLEASVTRCLNHGNSTKRVISIFEEIVGSLDAINEKSKNPEIKAVKDGLLHHTILFYLFLADLMQIGNNLCKIPQSKAMQYSLLPSKVERMKECLRKYMENI